MFKTLLSLYLEYSKLYPAVTVVASGWFIGVVTFLMRKVPGDVYKFLKRSTTLSVTIDNTYTENTNELYNAIIRWLSSSDREFAPRTFSAIYSFNGVVSVTSGYGSSWFIFKKRLFHVNRYKLASQGSEQEKSEVTITGFTRNRALIKELLQAVIPKKVGSGGKYKPKFYMATSKLVGDSYWKYIGELPNIGLDELEIDDKVRATLTNCIDKFLVSEELYAKKGLAWKKTICLRGMPGTGKTSIVRSCAVDYERDVYSANLSGLSRKDVIELISNVPSNAIILVEELDSLKIALDQRLLPESGTSNVYMSVGASMDRSDLLNILSGIMPLHDILLFVTTNYFEKLDAALVRPSRLDLVLDIGPLSPKNVMSYLKKMYEDLWGDCHTAAFEDLVDLDIPGSFLPEIYCSCEDPTDAIQEIVNKTPEIEANKQAWQMEVAGIIAKKEISRAGAVV